jgi:5-methylcytosine-specific restriction endonuclease McrA
MKECTKCHLLKSRSEFNRDKGNVDRLKGSCRECQKIYRRVHQTEKYRVEGICTKCGTNKAAPGKAKCNDCKDKDAQYQKNNAALMAALRHNRRARIKQMPGKLTEKKIEERKELDDYRCQRCGVYTYDLAVDHVVPVMKDPNRATPPGWRNDETNIQSLCQSCNSKKNHKNWWDYRDTSFDILVIARAPELPNGVRTFPLHAALRVKLDWRGPGHHWEGGMV